MSLLGPLTVAAAAIVLLSGVALAGSSFRLEIGPPVAAGTGAKVSKDVIKGKTVLAVRALVCDDLSRVQITGTAEGIRNGSRQSVPLDLLEVSKADAIYAVQNQWPADGSWVVHLKGSCSNPKAEASTLVPMNKMAFIREKTEVLREPATKKQVEDAVREHARSQS